MMRALEAGGMAVARNEKRDAWLQERFGDAEYAPNADGYFELNPQQYAELGFPRRYEGKLLKFLWGGIPSLVAGNYKLVVMRRNYADLKESYDAMMSKTGRGSDSAMPYSEAEYEERMAILLGIIGARNDMEAVLVKYEDVLADPLKVFNMLREANWPIDSQEAATVPNVKERRFHAA